MTVKPKYRADFRMVMRLKEVYRATLVRWSSGADLYLDEDVYLLVACLFPSEDKKQRRLVFFAT